MNKLQLQLLMRVCSKYSNLQGNTSEKLEWGLEGVL